MKTPGRTSTESFLDVLHKQLQVERLRVKGRRVVSASSVVMFSETPSDPGRGTTEIALLPDTREAAVGHLRRICELYEMLYPGICKEVEG